MKTKKIMVPIIIVTSIIMIIYVISNIILMFFKMTYTNVIKEIFTIGFGILFIEIITAIIIFLCKILSKENTKILSKIISIVAIIITALITLGVTYISILIFAFSYNPEHVIEKDGQKMVASVSSFLDVNVSYYEYINPFVRGTKLKIYECYGDGGYDPFEGKEEYIPINTTYYDENGNVINKTDEGNNDETTEKNAIIMNAKQIEDFNVMLNNYRLNGFLSSTYNSVKEINIRELLYDGAGINKNLTEEEYSYIMQSKYNGIDIGMDSMKFTKEDIEYYYESRTGEKILENIKGINLEYCEKYSFYYKMHGDSHIIKVNCISGKIDSKGYYHIVYKDNLNNTNQKYEVVIKKSDDGNYLFVSNKLIN